MIHGDDVTFHKLAATGNRIDLPTGTVNIGRTMMDETQPWILISSAMVSRHHCRLHVSGTGVVIEDVGRSGGTNANDGPRFSSRSLVAGDVIVLGHVRLILHL